ncbi:MAG: hypothetical protein ACREQ5_16975 [Candidatus Dormibacteria bacterium]
MIHLLAMGIALNCFEQASKEFNKLGTTPAVSATDRVVKHFVKCGVAAEREQNEPVYFASAVGYVYSEDLLGLAYLRSRKLKFACGQLTNAKNIGEEIVEPMIENYAHDDPSSKPILDSLGKVNNDFAKYCEATPA